MPLKIIGMVQGCSRRSWSLHRRDIDKRPANRQRSVCFRGVTRPWTPNFEQYIHMYIYTQVYGLYIHVQQLLIGANSCEGDRVWASPIIILKAITHSRLHNYWLLLIIVTYLYIVHIHMFMYTYVLYVQSKNCVNAHCTALSRPKSGHFAGVSSISDRRNWQYHAYNF